MYAYIMHLFNYLHMLYIFFPATRHGGAWGKRRYSSYSFSTSALDGGEWSASRPGRALPPGRTLPPGKRPPVPIVQEAGWAPEPIWTQKIEEKSFAPPEIEPRSPGRPVRSQTLYCLSYPGSYIFYIAYFFVSTRIYWPIPVAARSKS
jgi:hypothetical protein